MSRMLVLALLAAVVLCAGAPPARAAQVGALPGLSPCTIVAVQTLDAEDSGKAQPGDFFRFKAVNAVTVGNRIVIPSGTLGYGVVTIASPAGRGGRAGVVVLEPLYFMLPSGRQLGVVLDHNAADLDKTGASNNAPGYLGAIPYAGFAIGAFNYFHHGKDTTVPKGTLFAVFPSNAPATAKCRHGA